jgi:hypothetical protein
MGSLQKGPWGPITGKVGALVGSSRNGKHYLKTAPVKGSRKATPRQEAQQRRFKLVIASLKPMTNLFRVTYGTSDASNGWSLATGYALKNAVAGDDPNFTLDYSMVKVAGGTLATATAGGVSNANGQLSFTWAPNANTSIASAADKVVIVVYCPEKKEYKFSIGDATRADASATLDATFFTGKEVHTYLAFVSADNRKASDSVYTGMLQL